MSGHSKWDTIKRDKSSNDSKKGALFTKLSKDISTSAKMGGGDPTMNASLFSAIAKAKTANMPSDKIQKAIDSGLGITKSGVTLSEVSYEAYGPGEVGMIVDASTDNRNRTFSEVKSTLEKAGGRIVEGGAIAWLFEVRGYLYLPFESQDEKLKRENIKWGVKEEAIKLDQSLSEDFELELMELDGILDINIDEEGVTVFTEPDVLGKIKKYLDEKKIFIDEFDIWKIAKNEMDVAGEMRTRIEELIEKLEDLDDVQKVWTALS